MKLFNSTKQWTEWWARRKIDWKIHYMNPNHPHRILITEILKNLKWLSLMEVGCGAGANLVRIVKFFPGRQVGGIDVNPEAIAFAQTQFTNALLKVGSTENIPFSDYFCDVVLSDMCLIYVGPLKIKKHLEEIGRLARNFVIFCELHSPSVWQRFMIKWKEGQNVFNWPRLLEKNGFYDIQAYKIEKEFWPESDLQQKYGYIIVARPPKRL